MSRLAWWVILPIVGIASVTLYGILSAEAIEFGPASNFASSGGFGPNQVSAILGLGGGLALILFLTGTGIVKRLSALLLALSLLTLSALTFSRGGLYNAGVMLAFAMVHSFRSSRGRMASLLAMLVLGLAGAYLIYPRLNAFTSGMLGRRFADIDPTLRGQIAQADLELWFANPLVGVGPGVSKTSRTDLLGVGVAAHTEYTRLLAEHGTAGLLALLLMLVMCIYAYSRAPDRYAQIWVAGLLAWPLMEMTHSAMRIVAISFLFGLAMVNWADIGKPWGSTASEAQGK
jgi:hypothetical protein